MKQKILTFRSFDDCTLEETKWIHPSGCRLLKTKYSMISPGTELFCINQAMKSGSTVQPGYILIGEDETGQNYFLFPSLAQSSACHCNIRTIDHDSLPLPLPNGFPLKYAGFLRFINIGLHAFNQLKESPKHVAVIGLGPVGNLAAQSAKLLGCQVTGVDPITSRRKIALDCKINRTLVPEALADEQKAFDFVIDTVVSSDSLKASAAILRNGGECSLVGNIKDGDLKASEIFRQIWNHKLVFRSGWEMLNPIKKQSCGSQISTEDNLIRSVNWIIEGRYCLAPLLSDVVCTEIAEIKHAYNLLKNKPDEHMCISIQWQ